MVNRMLDQAHDDDVIARLPTSRERLELERAIRKRELRAVFALGLCVGVGIVVMLAAVTAG